MKQVSQGIKRVSIEADQIHSDWLPFELVLAKRKIVTQERFSFFSKRSIEFEIFYLYWACYEKVSGASHWLEIEVKYLLSIFVTVVMIFAKNKSLNSEMCSFCREHILKFKPQQRHRPQAESFSALW